MKRCGGREKFLNSGKQKESVASRPTLKEMQNIKQKKVRVATLISVKIDFRIKESDKEEHYIMV